MIEIGRVGLWTWLLDSLPTSGALELAIELEEMGWPCLWRPEASGRDALVSSAQVLQATTKLTMATGIALTWRFLVLTSPRPGRRAVFP